MQAIFLSNHTKWLIIRFILLVFIVVISSIFPLFLHQKPMVL